MARVDRFEDLIAWQKAQELTKQVYNITMNGQFSQDYGLRDQIRKAAVSARSNIAEGFDRAGRAEFHHFLVIAKGSVAEVRSQLYVALDVDYINKETFGQLKKQSEEVSRVINGLRSSVQKQRDQQ